MRNIKALDFGIAATGKPVHCYVLQNKEGMRAVISDYGAALISVQVPDRYGKFEDVVLRYDRLEGYEQDTFFSGGTIGRYANRIANGSFTLDEKTYRVSVNNGPNSLHGGTAGFHKRIWTAVERSTAEAQTLELHYQSADGEEGFPGELSVQVSYTLAANRNELRTAYRGTTTRPTVVNLTNHSYFNLQGDMARTILDHQLTIRAKQFTPVNATLIPTGEFAAVAGTPFDFQSSTAIGARIQDSDEQLIFGQGYDHNWVLQKSGGSDPESAATLYDPASGRVLEVLTTEPGLQFYSGNFLNGTARSTGGAAHAYRTGLCLETQHFPDSPNHAHFPSTALRPGEVFRSETILRFSTKG